MSAMNEWGPTDTPPDWQPYSEEYPGKDTGSVTPVGTISNENMVDLYSLPVRDLVEEIHRLLAMIRSLELEVNLMEQDIHVLTTIIKSGKGANLNLKSTLRQIHSLSNL